jgi:hypothetical protein
MDTTAIIAIVVIALLVLGAAFMWWSSQNRRTKELQSTFGHEYDRTVGEAGSRRDAERELQERQQRVQRLRIKPLTHEEVRAFDEEWQGVQAHFVDDPKGAIKDADTLVGRVMDKRGYPVGDFEQKAADVSVDHPSVVTHYREAHRISVASDRADATTEELRQAMQHYRALFADLLQTTEARR